MILQTKLRGYFGMDILEDPRLVGYPKAVKFDNKIRVSPAIFYLMNESNHLELDFLLRNVEIIDLDNPKTVKENLKLLPEGLLKIAKEKQ